MRTACFSVCFVILVVSMSCDAKSAVTVSADRNEIVVLKPFRVSGEGDFGISAPYEEKTKIITSANVTWIVPSLLEYGLRKGWALISINGKSVKLMTTTEFLGLLHKQLEPGEKITYEFSGKRGFFRPNSFVILTYTGLASKKRTPRNDGWGQFRPSGFVTAGFSWLRSDNRVRSAKTSQYLSPGIPRTN